MYDRYHLLYLHETTDKLIGLYVLVYIYSEQTRKQYFLNRVAADIQWISAVLNLSMNAFLTS
jgi:hypothetical protein